MKRIQVGISLSAIAIAIVHIIMPDLSIDAITFALYIIAIVPWLAPLFKSLEFPGGWKFEFKDLENTTNEASKAGLLSNDAEPSDFRQSLYQSVANEDPNLALAGLRIEIEKRVRNIAESKNIEADKIPVGRLLGNLMQQKIITGEERKVIQDLIGLLNRAVHGAEVDDRAAQWALDIGPRILRALDEKVL